MLESISHLSQVIGTLSASSQVGIVAVVLEAILRVIPSDKPLSILYFVEDAAHGLGDLAKVIGDGLDKVLPQRKS